MLGYVAERRVGVWEEAATDPQAEERRRQTLAFMYKRLEEMARPEPLVIEHRGESRVPADEWPR
jgi:hypothetical protein